MNGPAPAPVSRAEYDRLAKQRDLLREAFVAAYEGGKQALTALRELPPDSAQDFTPAETLEMCLTKAHEAFEKAKSVR